MGKGDIYKGGSIAVMFSNHSTDWQELGPDQLPLTPVLFPHIVDGKVLEGLYDVFTLIKQDDQRRTTSGYWGTVIDFENRISDPQQVLDRDAFKKGGKAMVTPVRFKSLADCERVLGPEKDAMCSAAMRDIEAMMAAIRRSVSSGVVALELVRGELTTFAAMQKVAK